MGRTSARFPLGPLWRHRGHEALTLSLLVLLLSPTFLHPPPYAHQRCDGSGDRTRRSPGSSAVCGLLPHSLPLPLHHLCAWEAQLPPSPHFTPAPGRFPHPPCPAGLARMDGVEARGLLRLQSGPSSASRRHAPGPPRGSFGRQPQPRPFPPFPPFRSPPLPFPRSPPSADTPSREDAEAS